jgi:tetratricopeptide (TPR) repeat protein
MNDITIAGTRTHSGRTLAPAIRRALRHGVVGLALVAAWSVAGPALDLPTPVGVAHAQKSDKKAPKLSNEVIKFLKPAQESIQKGEHDPGIESAKQALAVAKTPYDQEMSLRILMAGYAGKKDFAGYAGTVEQLLQLNPESITPEERARFYKQLAQINYQNKDYAKVQQYAQMWADGGGGAEAYQILAASYLVQKDCKNGIGPLEKSMEGKEPDESQLKQLNFCYFQNGDKEKRAAVMETLATKYPKRDYFIDLMNMYQDASADNRAIMNFYRLGLERDWLARESEFLEYADMALEAGAPAEALAAYQAGTKKGAVTGGERANRIKTQATQLTAEDKKTIAALDKEAKAGKNGEADVKVGLAYLGLGEYQKAIDATKRGLQPDRIGKVRRVDDAWMQLGIAYTELGNKAEAAKAFREAAKDPRMAKAAEIWIKLQAAETAPDAAAAAATPPPAA